MGTTRSNVVYKEVVSVFDFDRETGLTGLTSSDFAFSFLKDGSAYSSSITTDVTELTNGRYEVEMTFPATGFWAVFIEITAGAIALETHQLNINVSDVSSTTITDMTYESDLLVITMSDGSTHQVTISSTDSAATPTGEVGASSVGTSIDNVAGTLSFISRSEQ